MSYIIYFEYIIIFFHHFINKKFKFKFKSNKYLCFKGGLCIFFYILREVYVSFEIREKIYIILLNFWGSQYIFLKYIYIYIYIYILYNKISRIFSSSIADIYGRLKPPVARLMVKLQKSYRCRYRHHWIGFLIF